jgi:uncharacterized protein
MSARNSTFALITGASSGIGQEYARMLAARGYNLVLASNEKKRLDAVGNGLHEKYGVTVETVFIDLARPQAAAELYAVCREKGLEVDVLINNAGFFLFGEVVKTDPEAASRMVLLHALTPTMLCALFGADMKRRRRGHILNTASISTDMPYPGIALYGATKQYLKSFSRALRSEMFDYNVSVTVVSPGAVATNLFDRRVVDYDTAMRLGVMMKPDRVAAIALDAMFRRKALVVPGAINRIFSLLVRITPHWVIILVRRKTKLLPVDPA